MTTSSTHSLANPSISMRNELGLTIPLNGKSYHLKIYYKESDSAQEEEIASSCLNPCKSNFQYLLCRQIKEPCKTINISNFIAKSVCEVENTQGVIKSVAGFSLAGSSCSRVFQNLLNKMNSIRDKALNQKDTLSSSFIKIFLEDTQIRKRKIAEQSPQNPHIENLKKLKACGKEQVIGLDRLGNNCCVNATLQIILNNSELRNIWEEYFQEVATMYYEALSKGQESAPNTIGNEFRKQLQKSSANLIDKDSTAQDDPTAFLEVFFNICKEKLSHVEVRFERMKYKQVGDGRIDPSIQQPENHRQFRISINNQFNQKASLEELLIKHCSEVNEIEENGINVKYTSEDQYVSLPNHLIIDLFTNNRRDASAVCIPTNLCFPQDLLKDRHSAHTYDLEAFIVHLGETDKDGHYVAYRKVNNQWKKFDDHVVTDINENQLQQVLGNFQEEQLDSSHPYAAFQERSEYRQTGSHTLIDFDDEDDQELYGNFQEEQLDSSYSYAQKLDNPTVSSIDFENEAHLGELLKNYQEEKPRGFLHELLATAKSIFLDDSNPYVCMLSYSKKQT
ncbi:ubiquitin carboxyl-terminal hydrolase family protein [Candidatus Rhabdochlamydia sp. T3358]|uniref:ubiquitin carboxyl-terminal hydrolase n=1 Tax=Candidatus Rhabdochlamydia sp. T3358 TaxID=2099795 RepID=UPI0010B7E5F2|nr:ubiquitin carboxyl-terminal hydrolase family protein [Candidatus Rhabdochlamydia sp. T3358]VHO03181.1 Ubiquitin carboxyl-terminal hydrolase [Candidatus Rhabdochlamydia sp. T3358]